MSPNSHFVTALFVVSIAITGCFTVTPKPVDAQDASFDDNEQNSGIISKNANGYVVTPHFHDRWVALVAVYGRDFKPAIDAKIGWLDLGNATWLVDKQRMVQFIEMNRWKTSGFKPINPG